MHYLLPAPRAVKTSEPFAIIKDRDGRSEGVGEFILVDDDGATNAVSRHFISPYFFPCYPAAFNDILDRVT